MAPTSSSRPHEDVDTVLAEGIRYERGGVTARAVASFEEVIARADEHPAAAAEAWWRLANQHRLQSRWNDALQAAHAGAEFARAHGLRDQEADALNIEGAIWMTRGDYAQARVLFERMLALGVASGTRGKALQNLGSIAAEERRYEDAERYFLASRIEYAAAGDTRGEAITLTNLGRLQMDRGDLDVARATLEDAITEARQANDLELHAIALLNLGMVHGERHSLEEAEERITTAYGQFTIADNAVQRVRCLIELARMAAKRGDTAASRTCLLHARTVATQAELPREITAIDERLRAFD